MLRSEIEFGSFLAYSSHGSERLAAESKLWVGRIKRDELILRQPPQPMSDVVAARLRQRLNETPFSDWFHPGVSLIPAPASSPLKPGSLWVPYRIATAMAKLGLVGGTLPCLRRKVAVPKSATSRTSDRPRALQHYDSLCVENLAFSHEDVIVLDDVVTRGATLLAAVSRVQEALPGARVRGFAIVRTLSDPTEFKEMFAPIAGHITLMVDGQTARRP